MPRDPQFYEKLEFGNTYHVYNRTNNHEDLFLLDEMRFLFLRNLKRYLEGYFTIHSFCLLKNHFHLLVTVSDISNICKHLSTKDAGELLVIEKNFIEINDNQRLEISHALLNRQFRRLFTSYSVSFNNKFQRAGNLFHRPYKRKLVANDVYFKKLILYIHKNPLKHKLEESFDDYYWSSYQEYLNQDEYITSHKKTISVFKNLRRFEKFHHRKVDYRKVNDLLLEN